MRPRARIDGRHRPVAQFLMAGGEVIVQLGQEDVFDPRPERERVLEYGSTSQTGSITPAVALSTSTIR